LYSFYSGGIKMDRKPNLAALPGLWRGSEPVSRPTARELFTTAFSSGSAEPARELRASETNYSPPPLDFGSGGELIGRENDAFDPAGELSPSPQTVEAVLVASQAADASEAQITPSMGGIYSPSGRPGWRTNRRRLG
jgi:hypothetical protein